jgi:hypothetical protein
LTKKKIIAKVFCKAIVASYMTKREVATTGGKALPQEPGRTTIGGKSLPQEPGRTTIGDKALPQEI